MVGNGMRSVWPPVRSRVVVLQNRNGHLCITGAEIHFIVPQ